MTTPDLAPAAVAFELAVSPETVCRWFATGHIPGAYRINSREWRIARADLDAWKDQRRTPAVDEFRIEPRTTRSRAARVRRTA